MTSLWIELLTSLLQDFQIRGRIDQGLLRFLMGCHTKNNLFVISPELLPQNDIFEDAMMEHITGRKLALFDNIWGKILEFVHLKGMSPLAEISNIREPLE